MAGAGILTTAENGDNAGKFLRFMLSQVAQQYFAGKTLEYPLVEGVGVNRLLVPLEDIGQPEIDVASLADLEGTQTLLRKLDVLP